MPEKEPQIEKLLEEGFIDISRFCDPIVRRWLRRDVRALGHPEIKRVVIAQARSLIKAREAKIGQLRKEFMELAQEYRKSGGLIIRFRPIGGNMETAQKLRLKSNQIGGNASFLESCERPYLRLWEAELERELAENLELIGHDQDYPEITIYYEPKSRKFIGMERGEVTYRKDKIEVGETLSIDTSAGYEPIAVEIHVRTNVEAMKREELLKKEEEIRLKVNTFVKNHLPVTDKKTGEWKTTKAFGNIASEAVLKVGVTYRIKKPISMVTYPHLANIMVEKKEPEERDYPPQITDLRTGYKMRSFVVNLNNFSVRISGLDVKEKEEEEEMTEEEKTKRRAKVHEFI